MDYEDYIKYGNKVRYTWREYNYYAATAKGYGYEKKEKIVTICGTMREIDTKVFASVKKLYSYFCCEEDFEILVADEKGAKFYVKISEISPYAEINDLSFDELKDLRSQIRVGSIYLADYDNSFGVDRNTVCSICDDYLEWLYECFGEELADENDTPENFAEYVAA